MQATVLPCSTRNRASVIAAAIVGVIPLMPLTPAAAAGAIEDLSTMSLQQLANVQVTSVSKSAEPLRAAPAAIYVITHTDIIRSGASSIPQALQLAPNLLVTQVSASDYVVSARGFGGNPADQSFSNKLLVLIDGRSVYSPLYSGVYVDAQDVLLEDVDRIEIISGPGATLWGANAMNGVINIITRSAAQSDGGYVSGAAGNEERNASARYAGELTADGAYRVYAMAFRRDPLQLADGSSAGDGWSKGQGGYRFDWSHAEDSATLQGDLYRATEHAPGQSDGMIDGANALGRWQHDFSERSQLQLQAYYDLTERFGPSGQGAFVLRTYDVQLQDTIAIGALQRLVWGAGERVNDYDITDTSTLLFVPGSRRLTLSNVFAQDTIALTPALSLIIGAKLEDDPYSGWSFLPDARLSFSLSDRQQLWAAASKAVRSPTPFDDDVVEKLGSRVFLTGNSQFQAEKLDAWQLGYRSEPAANVSLSANLFYNQYHDLRSVEFSPGGALPLLWGNLMAGNTYGAEVWASLQLTGWWRLSPGFGTLHKRLRFEAGSSGLLGLAQAGDDPGGHATLSSSMDLPRNLSFDASLRYVSSLPDPALPAYYQMNARLSWRASRALRLSLNGSNLLHTRQLEFPGSDYVPRELLAQAQWTF
jgi:iron complex outermembrane receptor protein